MKWIYMHDQMFQNWNQNNPRQVYIVSEPRYINGVLYGTTARPYFGHLFRNYNSSAQGGYSYLYGNTTSTSDRIVNSHGTQDFGTIWIHGALYGYPDSFNYPSGNYNKNYKILNNTTIQGKRSFKDAVTLPTYVGGNATSKDWTQPINFRANNKQYIGIRFQPYVTPVGSTGNSNYNVYSRIDFLYDTGSSVAYDVAIQNGTYQFTDDMIDFGDVDQEVCEDFKNWLMSNTTVAKTAKITVKSYGGTATLAESPMLAPFTSVTISRIGSSVVITTNTAEQVQFTLTLPNKEFSGLSLHAYSATPLLRTARTSEFNCVEPTTFYECYGAVIPVPETYGINFYQSTAEVNRADKSNYLTRILALTGTLREGCSVIAPAFNILVDDEYIEGGITYLSKIMSCNYCYIPKFGRYYFITDISNVAHNIWRVSLSCDVLYTFWGGSHGINTLQGIIGRTADSDYVNNYIQDNQIMTEVRVDRTYDAITNGTDSFNTTDNGIKYNTLVQTFGSDI